MENKTLQELGLQLSEIRATAIEKIRGIFKEHNTDKMRFTNFSYTPLITHSMTLDSITMNENGKLSFECSDEYDNDWLGEDEIGTDSLMDVLGLISESKFAKEDSDEMFDDETIVIE